MNNGMKKALAVALAASMLLTACNNSNNSNNNAPAENPSTPSEQQPATPANPETPATPSESSDDYQITDFVMAKTATRELETWNWLHSQRAEDGENLVQFVDGLLESNNKGQLQPALATEWGTEDGGLNWKFTIRQGVQWVDWQGNPQRELVAQDWLTAMEWILNYHKNQSANTSMPMEMIKGATEYYEYTKNLSEEEGLALTATEGSKFLEMVGIAAPDNYTLTYECVTQKPYFDTLCTYVALFPIAQESIDNAGGAKEYASVNNEGLWYCGPYTCTEFIHGNSKTFTKNPHYWDTEAHLFETAQYVYVESYSTAYTLFENGEIDYVELSEANLTTILNDPNHKYHDNFVHYNRSKYSYQWHWNYDKRNEDGSIDENWNKAIANTAFRQSFYYGLDLIDTYKRTDQIDPLSVENNFYTMEGLVFTSDGTEYTKLVKKELGLGDYNGTTMVRYDKAKFDALKAQAMEELSAIGVTFPVELDYYISGASQTALDSATVLKNNISKSMGDDYVVLNICTYVSSLSKEVRDPQVQSIMSNGWGADYGDPMNYMGQEIMGYDNAWYANSYSNINKLKTRLEGESDTAWADDLFAAYEEYTRLVWEADAITDDMDARYAAFAKAEAYMIQNCLVMPYNYGSGYCLTKYDVNSQSNSPYGSSNPKMKNWKTHTEPYTQAEWQASYDAKMA